VTVFAIVFEYRVPAGRRAEFERVYASEGDWARFFAEDPAYRGSELWASRDADGRYVVVDRWDSPEAYEGFRRRRAVEYERRSAATETLYDRERVVGRFGRIP
jgi:heme-degrading monooxygenase HmoA